MSYLSLSRQYLLCSLFPSIISFTCDGKATPVILKGLKADLFDANVERCKTLEGLSTPGVVTSWLTASIRLPPKGLLHVVFGLLTLEATDP